MKYEGLLQWLSKYNQVQMLCQESPWQLDKWRNKQMNKLVDKWTSKQINQSSPLFFFTIMGIYNVTTYFNVRKKERKWLRVT